MSEPTLKLPNGADELLQKFPIKEPDFEAQAKAIEARVKGEVSDPGALLPPSVGLSFDDLLKAPELVAEAGEAMPPSAVRAAEPPKSNFAAMARKSVQKGDDDAADVARELLAATAQSRRPSAEMVERVRAAGRPVAAATSTPLPGSGSGAAEEAQRTSGVVARAEPAQAAPSNRGRLIGIAGAALALAACVALFMKSGQSENSTSAALAAERASDVPGAAQATPGAAAAAAKPSEGVMSPESLAAAPAAAKEAAKGGSTKAASGAGLGAPLAKPGAPAGTKPEAVQLEDDATPVAAAAPEKKAEAQAPEPPLKPAEGNSGDVPLTPSAGAVSSALSSVRSGAQACLAGQSDPVSAVVTFAADGRVLKVSAGGPAGACIQAALSKAHIRPFAKESFSANMTIRPP